MEWIAIIAYVCVGAYLTPRFARASYLKQRAMWRYNSKQESMTTGALLGWLKSIVWPVWLVVTIAVDSMTAGERAKEAEAERAKTIAGAKAVIARYEEDERRKWAAEFRKGSAK